MTMKSIVAIHTLLANGQLVPCVGPGTLKDVRDPQTGDAMPVDHSELAQALNDGRPMSPKLTYEFSRAAMQVENRRGRRAVIRFLDRLYGETRWSQPACHRHLAGLQLPYIVDFNRDRHLLDLYADREHLLVQGIARLGGTDHRFHIYRFDGAAYARISPEETLDSALPVLFKPLGCPLPESHYVASDADFVDYLTELMGGFGIPGFLKQRRRGLRYLLLGMNLDRDTERMLIDGIAQDADEPAGWAVIPEATPKASRFLTRHFIEMIHADVDVLYGVNHGIGATARSP